MPSLSEIPLHRFPLYVAQAAGLFLAATVLFDVIHYILHRFLESRWRALRWLGGLHQAHHDFFDQRLQFHDRLVGANLVRHVIPEYLNQVVFTSAGFLFLDPWPVGMALAYETVIFVAVVVLRGMDRNHVPYESLPESRGAFFGLFVTPA